jgi:hypothetical protein
MELTSLGYTLPLGQSISRPTSVPLRDEDWDSYVQERKLLQPPVGVTPPIETTTVPAKRIPVAPAVTEALNKRKERESAIGYRESSADESEDIPLSQVARHTRQGSADRNHSPVAILPPKRQSPIAAPIPQRANTTRIRTFEELNERHREKMRGLQSPITRAQQEEADIRAARQRWERSMALEREAVTKRQAEKAAQLDKKKRADDPAQKSRTLSPDARRSQNHDKLTAFGSSSKRLSTMKVEDWQKYQQDVETGVRTEGHSPKRQSRTTSPSSGVPFPDRGKQSTRRKSKDLLSWERWDFLGHIFFWTILTDPLHITFRITFIILLFFSLWYLMITLLFVG